MKYSVKTVVTEEQAIRVWELFLIPNIIGQLSEGEKQRFKENILATISNENGAFFYVELKGEVAGAVGAWENYIQNGGYIIEHFAVQEKYRGAGLGLALFFAAEEFIAMKNPRYITIETGDDIFYSAGRAMYEKNGYKRVSHFPKYYDPASGRIDYMKVVKRPSRN